MDHFLQAGDFVNKILFGLIIWNVAVKNLLNFKIDDMKKPSL